MTFALETLSTAEGHMTVGMKHHVKVASSTANAMGEVAGEFDTWLELDITSDIVLTARDDEHYYIRYDLSDGMVFTQVPPQPLIRVPYSWDDDDDATPAASTTAVIVVDPEHDTYDSDNRNDDNVGMRDITSDADAMDGGLAFGGNEDQATVIFRLPKDAIPDGIDVRPSNSAGANPGSDTTTRSDQESQQDDYPVGTTFSLRLPVHLAVPATEGTYNASVSGYEDLSEARRFTADTHGGAALFASTMDGGVGVIQIAASVAEPEVMGNVVMADVGTPQEMGGPFRRFVDPDTEGEQSETATLASVTLGLVDMPGHHARNNLMPVVVGDIISGAVVMVTAEAGDFAVGTFNIGTCAGAAMDLGPEDADMMAPEPADATEAMGMGSGTSMDFCLDVGDDNEDVIPEVGDPIMPNGYMMTVTPNLANAAAPAGSAPEPSDPMPAGSIDHNGTTVQVTFLSDSPNYNQRLVIVNRGSDPAMFLMEEFQTEPLKTVEDQMGSDLTCGGTSDMMMGIRGAVPGNSRCVMRVQDRINVVTDATADATQRSPRTAGTLVVAAPTRNIDVMTIQVIPGTRELDTTVYQHDE